MVTRFEVQNQSIMRDLARAAESIAASLGRLADLAEALVAKYEDREDQPEAD